MNVRNCTERKFKCPNCGYTCYCFKKSSKKTKIGHLKNLYCPKCKDTHNFIQIDFGELK